MEKKISEYLSSNYLYDDIKVFSGAISGFHYSLFCAKLFRLCKKSSNIPLLSGLRLQTFYNNICPLIKIKGFFIFLEFNIYLLKNKNKILIKIYTQDKS